MKFFSNPFSLLFFLDFLSLSLVFSKPDPNFYIFLCFGQSNMEGQGKEEDKDKICPERFKVMAAINMTKLNREQFHWYTAVPPLCREGTHISPADYFGRHLVEKLPKKITIGVINVSIAGCKIQTFDEELMEECNTRTESWFIKACKAYDNNPFRVLINAAKKSQEDGVIKGILLHQGESNSGNKNWPTMVKKVYDKMLAELDLKEEDVPLLVGEVVRKELNGTCGKHNEVIATLPNYINNSHVISSEGLPPQSDNVHFTTESYRIFGRRYAEKMLELLAKEEEKEKENLDGQGESNAGIIVLVVILCLVIVGGIGFFAYKRFIRKKQLSELDDKEKSSPILAK